MAETFDRSQDLIGRFGPFELLRFSIISIDERPVCTENLNPDIVVMKAAKDRVRFDASGPLNLTRDRRIFVQ